MTEYTRDHGSRSLQGFLTADPVERTIQGERVTTFRMGHKPSHHRNPQGKVVDDRETIFVDVIAREQLGEHVLESLHKGNRVVVIGDLFEESFTRKDGSEGFGLKVPDAFEVAASLRNVSLEVPSRSVAPSGPAEGMGAGIGL